MIAIPENSADLLSWDKKAFAFLALVRADGSPHVTPVWFDWDGQDIIVNTARGRVKDRLLHKRRPVALAMADPQNPYRFIQIRGNVIEETEEEAYEQICRLNQKYHGAPTYPRRPGEVRVTYKIRPEHIGGARY